MGQILRRNILQDQITLLFRLPDDFLAPGRADDEGVAVRPAFEHPYGDIGKFGGHVETVPAAGGDQRPDLLEGKLLLPVPEINLQYGRRGRGDIDLDDVP